MNPEVLSIINVQVGAEIWHGIAEIYIRESEACEDGICIQK